MVGKNQTMDINAEAKEKALQVKIDKAEKNIEYVRVRYLKVSYSAIFGESERAKGSERDMSYHTAAHNVGVVLKKVLFIGVFGFVATLDFTSPWRKYRCTSFIKPACGCIRSAWRYIRGYPTRINSWPRRCATRSDGGSITSRDLRNPSGWEQRGRTNRHDYDISDLAHSRARFTRLRGLRKPRHGR